MTESKIPVTGRQIFREIDRMCEMSYGFEMQEIVRNHLNYQVVIRNGGSQVEIRDNSQPELRIVFAKRGVKIVDADDAVIRLHHTAKPDA